MIEQWKDIPGFEGRYQVSNLGRVKSLAFKQRYTHWRTGAELFRQTREKILAVQLINSGYEIVHLHLGNKRKAFLVHRLVASAFLPGPAFPTINHKNGIKTNNSASNLEWATYSQNHNHAVEMGLNLQALPVSDPITGVRYPSISRAARLARKSHRKVRATFLREGEVCQP